MRKAGWGLLILLFCSEAFGTTVSDRIRYRFDNQTSEHVIVLLQLQAADSAFSQPDTFALRRNVTDGVIELHHRSKKRFQKVILLTNQRRYESAVFRYENGCAGYRLTLHDGRLTLGKDWLFPITDFVRQFAVFFIFITIYKILPHLLLSMNRLRWYFWPFLLVQLVQALLSIWLLDALDIFMDSIDRLVNSTQAVLAILPWLLSVLESVVYQQALPDKKLYWPMSVAIVLGALLGSVAGPFLLFLLLFLMGGC